MGNPSIYYKRALQDFAYCLACEEDNYKLAKELYTEDSVEKLESYILEKKNELDENLFFYNAGLASQRIFDDAYEEGCDASNACGGGIIVFEYFIGLAEGEDLD